MTGWQREAGATLAVGLAVAALCLLMAYLQPYCFWHDDNQLSAVPAFLDMRRAWLAGEWPLISNFSWNGGSYLGEYQPGLFSPLTQGAIFFAAGMPGGMTNVATAYATVLLAVTAMGAFRVGRGEGLAAPYAAIVGLVAALNGWSVGWAASAWAPAMAGFAAMTWTWWGLAAVVRPGATPRLVALAALGVYLLMTSGWPHTIFMCAVVSAWLLAREAWTRRTFRPIVPLTAAWLLGIGLSAPAWLPFIEYLPSTQRASTGAALQWNWLVPATALPGLALPTWVTHWDGFLPTTAHVSMELANGLVPTGVGIALLVALGRGVGRPAGWALILTAIGLILAMAPSIGMFRWSFRWLPLFHVALALAAAHGLAAAHARPREAGSQAYAWLGNPGAWALLAVAAAGIGALAQPRWTAWFLPALLGIAALWAAAEDRLPGTSALRRWTPAVATAAAFLATYTAIPNGLSVPFWPMSEEIRRPAPFDPTIRYVALANGLDYFTSGGNSRSWGALLRPGGTMLAAGVPFVNGYSALFPAGLGAAFQVATHGYLEMDRIQALALEGTKPGGLLDRMGVDGVVLGIREKKFLPQVIANGWSVVADGEEATVLHRDGPRDAKAAALTAIRFLPLKAVPPWQREIDQADGVSRIPARAGVPVGETITLAARPVTLVADHRNGLTIEVGAGPGPGMVRLDRHFVPGWRAQAASGQPIGLVALEGCQLGLELPPGVGGRIEVRYFPRALERGLWAAGATALVMLLLLGWRRRPTPAQAPVP